MKQKYKMCKDCGTRIPYVRQKVRCSACYKKRDNKQRAVRKSRVLGCLPVELVNGKVVHTKESKRIIRRYRQLGTKLPESRVDAEGEWVREQLYNFRFDIVEFETDQQRKERKLTEYRQWIEQNL